MNSTINEPLKPYKAVIKGCGSSVPDKILANQDLAELVNTSDEWITTRTGIKKRHITNENETTAMLASNAAKMALEDAGITADKIDILIVATITPEMVFPSTACFVQMNIGAINAFAFDLSAACSGYVYGVSIVQQFIESGRFSNALVIGAETLTKITDFTDRASCILFGDGAGATVISRGKDNDRGIICSTMYSDGSKWETLNCQAYGSKYPADKKLDDPKKIYMQISGREVYQLAVRRIVESVQEVLEKARLTIDDVDMVISHQMNARIIESAQKRLNLPEHKVFIDIDEYGNTSSASIPLALDDCIRQGKLKQGDVVIFVAFGAGLTWGANLIKL